MIVFYGAGTIVLQLGFQHGRALTTAGIATLATNAIPIGAAMTLFEEPLPDGILGGVRIAAFGAVVAGAVALAPVTVLRRKLRNAAALKPAQLEPGGSQHRYGRQGGRSAYSIVQRASVAALASWLGGRGA